jgi:hypothetical protein
MHRSGGSSFMGVMVSKQNKKSEIMTLVVINKLRKSVD